jgi:hypothetical protein
MAGADWFRGRGLAEFPSWRAADFRRFRVGVLANGREEWLEFWRGNHLLPPFDEAYRRREVGEYGGRACDFLALPDLIRAKETERDKDWQDIRYLEETLDARTAAAVRSGAAAAETALAGLRSRRGLETHLRQGRLESTVASAALARATNPITVALLLPAGGDGPWTGRLEPAVTRRLLTAPVGSPLHWTLVEAVRRRYKADAVAADRADKQSVLDRMNRTS